MKPRKMTVKLASVWHKAPRRWGHSWHAMCSYMAMFPPAIPRVFIEWLTKPGDAVYDPFSGRGTTVLEACNSGRYGLGSDANPMAWILSSTKASPPSRVEVLRRLAALRAEMRELDSALEPEAIRAVFDPAVLGQLLWLRKELSFRSAPDRYLYSVLLGILHLNAGKGGHARGLSISMPNTFSMAPGYVIQFKKTHGLVAPKVNVLDKVADRIDSLGKIESKRIRGKAWLQSAAEPIAIPKRFSNPRLIFTSPPYLGVMKYAKMNWLRMWLLGQEPSSVDRQLFSSGSLPKYVGFMTTVLKELEAVLATNGRICLVIGDVGSGINAVNLAEVVADSCVRPNGMKIDAIVRDALPIKHKVSRIWGERRGQATATDRILILSRARTPKLPRIPTLSWSGT